jgi:prepilin-type N-terminal cleavage/methylation domain-containing protein
MKKKSGFTLIELMVSMSIIAIIVGVYLLVANPAGQLAASRNTKRQADLQSIMLAIQTEKGDQSNEQFSCSSGALPTTTTRMKSGIGGYNIAPCIVIANGSYGLFSFPFDPNTSSSYYISNSNYDSGYSISINSSTGQITVSAPYAELKKTISITE